MGRDDRWRALATAAVGAGLTVGVLGCSQDTRTVLVDYDHDEFATQFIRYVPDRIQAHAGDTITFRQAWTGEPHTVTLGTLVDEVLAVTMPLVEEYGDLPDEEIPPEVFEEYFAAAARLPAVWSEDEEAGAAQAAAQPCLIVEGAPPLDGEPCEVRELPPFQGTEVYYNSGVIPYEGPQGNVFVLELSETIEPGEYAILCLVHGSFHVGVLEVIASDQPLPTPREAADRLRGEVTALVEPYESMFARAQSEDYRFRGEQHDWNYAGLLRDDAPFEGIINEFVPETIVTSVDEPVVWRMFGPHSISFDVPEYLPIIEFLDDGTVQPNAEIWEPAGGAPEVPMPTDGPPPTPLVVDGGTYDGEGYWSSGVLWNDLYVEYTLRFSTPGDYRYACVIHPPMVGTVRVTE